MTTPPPPVDQASRDRIGRDGLDETLFVEAGAGSGKTHELVARVTGLVLDRGIPLREIAAITFTEAAAAELRDRIRQAFEEELGRDPSPDRAAACRAALDDTDVAAIGTLHSFALRILGEHPIEIALPPRVDILDEVSSQLAFEDRWAAFVDALYRDERAEDLLLRAHALGIRIEPRAAGTQSLKDAAKVMGDNWDRLPTDPVPDTTALPPLDLGPIRTAVADVVALADGCLDADDKLLRRIETELLPAVARVVDEPDPYRALQALEGLAGLALGGAGRKECWPDVQAARNAVKALSAAATEVRGRVVDQVLRRLAERIAAFTTAAADERRAEGRLEFHDLLVLARRLVRDHPSARAALRGRYTRLLLDEFQDTDPIQVEVATLVASAIAGTVHERWERVPTDPGRLFFVGDPKQSIYRFRRADIALFLRARSRFGGDGRTVPLTQNFRTVEPVVEWVNDLFGGLMGDGDGDRQPAYQPLQPCRQPPPGADHRVVLVGGAHERRKADELRQLEAGDIAAVVASIRADPSRWMVADGDDWRPAELNDVTILLPTRTSLRPLEDALEARHIPYRVDTGTLVYDTQEVRDVLSVLRVVDDPTDRIALVAALRSPLYACSDVDLFTWRHAGGPWTFVGSDDLPDGIDADHPVAQAYAHLQSLWRDRWWQEPSELIERLLRERRALLLAFAERRPREVWRRLRFLEDQARAFQEAGGGHLRAFIEWAELQRNEGSRVHEPLLPETDDTAVSILTIHGAKGLEFPITIVSGLTTELRQGRSGVDVYWERDGEVPELKLTKAAVTDNFDRLADLEREMDEHERLRLLYVAVTRARDHLVVSAHHATGKQTYGGMVTAAASLDDGPHHRWLDPGGLSGADDPSLPRVSAGHPTAAPPLPLDDREAWRARRAALLETAQPRFLSATAVAGLGTAEAEAGADDDGVGADVGVGDADGGRPAFAWRRGRAGTAIGRAVHATLQLADPSDDATIDALATQQAHLEALPDAAPTVAAMARSALRAPSVVAAQSSDRVWREVYVAAPLGDRAVEGYIDLLYQRGDGALVVVDYKTDSVDSDADVDAKVDRYRIQLAAYAAALEASTGLTVAEARLVFCTTGDPIEREVPDLRGAIAEVEARLAAEAS